MSSKYLEWKYRNVEPDKPAVLTGKQRFKNLIHYYKWHVIIGAAVLAIGADLALNALGIGKEQPDHTIAYVGGAPLPSDTAKQLETRLSELADDINGDNKVIVRIKQYPTDTDSEDAEAAAYASASNIRLLGDIESGEICFFILDDAETFHQKYEVLATSNGLYAENNDSLEYYPLTSLPPLKDTVFGDYTYTMLGKTVTGSSDELLGNLYIARCGNDGGAENLHDKFWETLTKGVSQ